jgi:hypothetical protein
MAFFLKNLFDRDNIVHDITDDTEKKVQHIVAQSDSLFGDDIVNAAFDLEHEPTRQMIKFHEGYYDIVERDIDGYLVGGWSDKLPPNSPLKEGSPVDSTMAKDLFNASWESDKIDSKKLFHDFSNWTTGRQAGILTILHIQGYDKFTDLDNGFPTLIKEANKPNPDWDRIADEFKYASPLESKADSMQSDLYIQTGGRSGGRGEHIYQLLKGTKTVDDILNIYK